MGDFQQTVTPRKMIVHKKVNISSKCIFLDLAMIVMIMFGIGVMLRKLPEKNKFFAFLKKDLVA